MCAYISSTLSVSINNTHFPLANKTLIMEFRSQKISTCYAHRFQSNQTVLPTIIQINNPYKTKESMCFALGFFFGKVLEFLTEKCTRKVRLIFNH